MKIWVQLIRKDLLEKTEEILADCNAIYKDQTLIYKEKDDDKSLHEIHWKEDEILILRKSEFKTEVHLNKIGKGIAKVHSQFGVMELETNLIQYDQNDDRWMIEYQIISQDDVVTHQQFIWILKGVENERN